MGSQDSKKPNFNIALNRQHVLELSKKLSGEACQVMLALVASLQPKEMSFVADLDDIIKVCPMTTNQVKQALDELKKNNVIKETKNQSGQSYTVNHQTLEIIVIDVDEEL
jgi:RIO-like serine/threonine protein kinase